MKIAVLHGAEKNAGDHLIKNRAICLLRHFYPEATISEYFRNDGISQYVNEINAHDLCVIAGGPYYFNGFIGDSTNSTCMFGVSNISIPISFMGGGWFGRDSETNTVYSYDLGDRFRSVLKSAQSRTGYLGCRDIYSVNVLRNNGLDNGLLTGCPAWYDLEYVGVSKCLSEPLVNAKKIYISNPADPAHYPSVVAVSEILRKLFPDAEIAFVVHRKGDDVNVNTIATRLFNLGIRIRNISELGAEGFSIYDDCDLHIGYRVHAHIYCLSKRRRTILIEEDGRGAGVNDTLGLKGVKAYCYAANNSQKIVNGLVPYEVEDAILNNASQGDIDYQCAFMKMIRCFENMKTQILNYNEVIN